MVSNWMSAIGSSGLAQTFYVRANGSGTLCNGLTDGQAYFAPDCAFASSAKAATMNAPGVTVIGPGGYNSPSSSRCSGVAYERDKPALSEADAIEATKPGNISCGGSWGDARGFVGGKGWIPNPIPGDAVLWMSEGGTVETIGTPAARRLVLDMRPGQIRFVGTHPASRSDRLMWKVLG